MATLLGGAALACVALVYALFFDGDDPTRRADLGDLVDPGAAAGFNVLFITLDTTRVDHLSCYGYQAVTTPTIDSLLETGVRFDHAFTPVPVTLPAHASMMTGLEPYHHGVRSNGRYRLAEEHTTLAETLRGQGYLTAAFVSTFALDERFGLSQGFDTYDFRISNEGRAGPTSLASERGAGHVTEAALRWLSAQSEVANPPSFFLWVHYYDPHAPYHSPIQASQPLRFTGLPPITAAYDAEIAFADEQIQRLLSALDRRGLRERTLVVLVTDHGEGLGDHGEDEHGGFIYDETVRVAWLLSCPALFDRAYRVDDRVVGVIDVAPTVLELLGVASSADVDGLGLLTASSDPDRAIYLETLTTKESFACAPLYGLRRLSDKLIIAPRAEYYDLQDDPREADNCWEPSDPEVAMLTSRLEVFVAAGSGESSAARTLSAEEHNRLAALGYVGFDAQETGELADPKDRIPIMSEIREAIMVLEAGRVEEALAIAKEKAALSPGMDIPVILVSQILEHLERREEAVRVLDDYARQYESLEVLVRLARLHSVMGQYARMETALQAAELLDPHLGVVPLMRGNQHAAEGRFADAIHEFERALELDAERIGPDVRNRLQAARQLLRQSSP
jgi:tetratricopeptide (TPR) repeat protein